MARDLFAEVDAIIECRSLTKAFSFDEHHGIARFGLVALLKWILEVDYCGLVTFRIYQIWFWRFAYYMKLRKDYFAGQSVRQRGIIMKTLVGLVRPRLLAIMIGYWRYRVLVVIAERFLESFFNVSINGSARIGRNFKARMNGIGITGQSQVGKSVNIRRNVALLGWRNKAPVIGDNVTLGYGAIIIGGVTVGDNATVSVGSVVIQNVPVGATVMGNPARVVFRRPPTENE